MSSTVPVETKCVLIEVVSKMFMADGTLVRTTEPTIQKRDAQMCNLQFLALMYTIRACYYF